MIICTCYKFCRILLLLSLSLSKRYANQLSKLVCLNPKKSGSTFSALNNGSILGLIQLLLLSFVILFPNLLISHKCKYVLYHY